MSSSLAVAKTACKETSTKVKEAKFAAMTAGVNLLKLYGNLLSNEARQPWEKVMKAQVMKAPWEDIFRIHSTPTRSWDSFYDCVMFHHQMVFQFDMGEALR